MSNYVSIKNRDSRVIKRSKEKKIIFQNCACPNLALLRCAFSIRT